MEITKVEKEKLTSGLSIMLSERALLMQQFDEVSKMELLPENIKTFKALRLKFVKNRTSIAKWHKENKAFFLAGGRFVDSIKNKEIAVNKKAESVLLKAEKHFETLEKEAKEKEEKQNTVIKGTENTINQFEALKQDLESLKTKYSFVDKDDKEKYEKVKILLGKIQKFIG